MSRRTHVWLLARGDPDDAAAVQPFLQGWLVAALSERLPFAWLRRLVAWGLSHLRSRRLLLTCGEDRLTTSQHDTVCEQARLLSRALGQRYDCQPVFQQFGPSAQKAAAALGSGAQVVLVSLYPYSCAAFSGRAISAARRAMGRRTDRVIVVESYARAPSFVEALAETLREAIVDLSADQNHGQDGYEVVFLAPVEYAGEAFRGLVEETAAAVVRAARLARPHQLVFGSPLGARGGSELAAALRDRAPRSVAIVVPLGFTAEHLETRAGLGVPEEPGVRIAPVVAIRPTFIRCLADLVQQAERAADWTVPEDDIRRAAEEAWAIASSS